MSAGLDDLSPYFLKKCVPCMLKPLLELLTVSIREDIFPYAFKKSVVKPVYKKGDESRCKQLQSNMLYF
jgi:hypothetical protein